MVSDDAADDWDMLRGGLRADWAYSDDSSLTFISEVYEGKIGESVVTPLATPPYVIVGQEDRNVSGGFGLLAWNRTISATSSIKLQTYYDRTKIEDIAPRETRDTFDIDMQYLFALGNRNALVAGLGARISEDETEGDFTISLDPSERTQRIYSAFIQDEITLVEDRLSMIIGTKVEKNNFNNDDLIWEPNVRLSWNVTDSHLLWSSVARAVRNPSRVEQNGTINGGYLPPNAGINVFDLPLLLTINGDPNLEAEEVTAYELGYRGQLTDTVETDVSLFYNQYENLRTLSPNLFGISCQPSGTPPAPPIPPVPPPSCAGGDTFVQLPILMVNGDDVDSYGAEFNLSWRATDALYLQGSYTYLHVDDNGENAFSSAGADNPTNQFSVRSLWNMSAATKFDLWLRYVGALDGQGIPSYLTLDAKLSWMPVDSLELSLVGRNLLEAEHAEFLEEYGATVPTEIPREAFVQLDWHF
jgi:iron complex outermembrane receptor protein